ncbi:MAG: HU family DNA-binding protein [Lachnospiraceae bacterium]|nr:HU family DNA-binding protein [Lachnospiraceae bacterium]
MTRKITFPQLVEALCAITASDNETASDFIKEVFESITSALARGENAAIKGLGTFMVTEGNTISWIPDEQLAAAVNEPFAFFEAVELEDGVTEETLAAIPPVPGVIDNEADATQPHSEAEVEQDIIEEPDNSFPADMPPIPGTNVLQEQDNDHDEEPVATQVEQEVATALPTPSHDEPVYDDPEEESAYYDDDEEEEKPKRKCRLHPCMTFVAGLILGLAIGYFGAIYAGDHIIESAEAINDASTADTIEAPQQSTEVQDSLPTEEPTDTTTEVLTAEEETMPYLAIDTVTPNRYLTTMSRQYYGDYRFWVYIYEENKDAITNPDRINPGTTVIIPRKEKYGIDVNDKESLAKAERKSREIQAEKRK